MWILLGDLRVVIIGVCGSCDDGSCDYLCVFVVVY